MVKVLCCKNCRPTKPLTLEIIQAQGFCFSNGKCNTREINGISIQDMVTYYNVANSMKVLSWLDIDSKHNFY